MNILMVGEQHLGHSINSIKHGLQLCGHAVDNVYTRKLLRAGGLPLVRDTITTRDYSPYDIVMLWNPRKDLNAEMVAFISQRIPVIWYTNDAIPHKINDTERERRAMARLCAGGIYPSSTQVAIAEGHGQVAALAYPPFDLWPWRYPESTVKVADVMFMANTCYIRKEWPHMQWERRELARALIDSGVDFKAAGHWDENPRGWGTEYGGIDREHYYGFIPHDNLPGILRNTPIHINNHPCCTLKHYTNYRMVLTMCTGGFVLTDKPAGLDTVLRDGEHVVYYASPGDLVEKVVYYLAHERERLEVALRGQKRMLRLSSCAAFAQKVEKIAQKIGGQA